MEMPGQNPLVISVNTSTSEIVLSHKIEVLGNEITLRYFISAEEWEQITVFVLNQFRNIKTGNDVTINSDPVSIDL